MAFIIDKEEVKPGLIIFRRSDVAHRNWYCRVKLPKADRYKTISLKTADINTARDSAYEHDADIRFRLKHDVPVFNRPFRDVAQEYLVTQQARARRGEISEARPQKIRALIEGALDDYVGATQIHLIGDELWQGYPAWRRENGVGRYKRNGVREVSPELAEQLAARETNARIKALHGRGIKRVNPASVKPGPAFSGRALAYISDATIRYEMSIFGAIMNFAVKKRYVPASQRFTHRPKFKTMRRDAFTLEEYRALHSKGRAWVKAASTPTSLWYRTVCYNMVLIACNTGMRPSELKNLRWRDISTAKDREGREIMVVFVQGKGKSRQLVAPRSVGAYLDRIRAISRATELDDNVFTTSTGAPNKSLYKNLVEDMLVHAGLRDGPQGMPRSTYCFRHTYATLRLGDGGVDVYFLAEQMGTTVKMIEEHYGHVNTIKHADRVLQGMGGWEANALSAPDDPGKAAKRAALKQPPSGPASKGGRKPR